MNRVVTRRVDAAAAFRAALALHTAGESGRAIAALRELVSVSPSFAPARNALGVLLLEAGATDDAITVLEPLARESPPAAAALVNLGNAYVAARRFDDAVAAFERAIRREPQVAGNHYALGRARQLAGEPEAAIAAYRAALARDASHVEAWANLAAAYNFVDRYADGIAAAREAIMRAPSHAGAHFNLGAALLAEGQWAAGWRAFEWRTRTDLLGGRTAPSRAPVWCGEVRAGATLLVYAEQGFGDTLQFVRYLPLVQARGLRVVFVCQRSLVRLLHANRVADAVLPEGAALPAHDWQVSLSSLAGVLQLHDDAQVVVHDAPYLVVPSTNASRATGWSEVPRSSRPRIGVVWAGHPTHVNDRHRSIGLAAFTPLFAAVEAEWVSLQAGPRAAERDGVSSGVVLTDGTRGGRDFLDTASTLRTLDAVVSVDSAVAHLAGALGVPTWLLLPRIGLDWRWRVGQASGTDAPIDDAPSPWYASVRTLRQRTPGAWDDVMAGLAARLAT